MAYENIRLRKQNFTIVDGYFWSVDEDADAIIVKTDDGTIAYSYPLDHTISNTVKSLEYDGRNLWTLMATGSYDLRIQRWYISNYVATLRDTFDFTNAGSPAHKFSSEAFTVEHYDLTIDSVVSASSLDVNDNSGLATGYTVTIGPSTHVSNVGAIEEKGVLSTSGSKRVQLDGNLTYSYQAGDRVTFYKRVWLFNNYDGIDGTTGAIYKIDAYTGSILDTYAGGAFQSIKACTFFTIPDYVFDTANDVDTICYVKGPNLIFLNPSSPATTSYGSMAMDNVEDDQATNIPIYDLAMYGTNIYRLQLKATYYGSTEIFANSLYSYQLSTLRSFITSISLSADPAILPATGVSTSTVTAIVKDQFNLPVESKLVTFTEDDATSGEIHPDVVSTDANGTATTTYTSGTTAGEIRITATAAQG